MDFLWPFGSWRRLYMRSTRQLLWQFWDILITWVSHWHPALTKLFEVQAFSPINTKPVSNDDLWMQKNTSSRELYSLQGTSYNNSAKADFLFSLQVRYIPSTYFNGRWKTFVSGSKVFIFSPKIIPLQTQRYNYVVPGASASAKLCRQ